MKKCPYCGSELFDEAEFCLFCMKELTPKKDLGPFRKNGGAKLALAIAVTAVISVALTSLFFIVFMKRDSVPQSPVQSETPASGDPAEKTNRTDDVVITDPETNTPNDTVSDYPVTVSIVTESPDTTVYDDFSDTPQITDAQTEATVTGSEPSETTKAADETTVPETKPASETTTPETETPGATTDVETTETVSEYVLRPYHITTIQEMHDSMKYKREKYCPPPVDTLWCTTPLYDMNGWRGYGYEYRKLIRELDENENVISRYDWVQDDTIYAYINKNDVKSVFVWQKIINTSIYNTDDYYKNEGINVIGGATAYICAALDLIEYIDQSPPEINQFYDARMYALHQGLWLSERKIPGFQRHDRPDVWRGILQELGINDKNDLQNEGKRENVQCYYWEIVLPEGERDIKLTIEYREFTTGNGEETHLEAVMVVEYAE